jgi:hypothetical protein
VRRYIALFRIAPVRSPPECTGNRPVRPRNPGQFRGWSRDRRASRRGAVRDSGRILRILSAACAAVVATCWQRGDRRSLSALESITIGGEAGIRILIGGFSKWLMAWDFWQQALATQTVGDPKLSAPVPWCPLQSPPVSANCWQHLGQGRSSWGGSARSHGRCARTSTT